MGGKLRRTESSNGLVLNPLSSVVERERAELARHWQLRRERAGYEAERLSAAAMADRLNAEGFRPPKRAGRFTREMVRRLLWHLGTA